MITELEKTVRSNIEREIANTEFLMRCAGDEMESWHAEMEVQAIRFGVIKTRIEELRNKRGRLIQSLESRTNPGGPPNGSIPQSAGPRTTCRAPGP